MEAACREYNAHLGYLDDVVRDYKGLVWKIAQKYQWAVRKYPSIEMDDLISEGYVGIVKAFHGYDPDKFENGQKFTTYAYPAIQWSIHDFVRDKAPAKRLPKSIYVRSGEISQKQLENESVEDIAVAIGCTVDQAAEALKSLKSNVIYLDQEIKDDEGFTLLDQIGTSDDLSGSLVQEFLTTLKVRERKVLEMRMDGYTHSDIGKAVGITQAGVSRLLMRIGEKLHEFLGESEGNELKITKEKYLELKDQKMTDSEVLKQFHMGSNTLINLKKEWGIVGLKTPATEKSVAISKPPAEKVGQPKAIPVKPADDANDREYLANRVSELKEEVEVWKGDYSEAAAESDRLRAKLADEIKSRSGFEQEIRLLKSLLKNYL